MKKPMQQVRIKSPKHKVKPACIKCGSPMKKGWCVDETCPFSDSVRKREWLQHCKNVNDIIIHVPGFDPPIPNMKNKTIAMRVKCVGELRDALSLVEGDVKAQKKAKALIIKCINRLNKGA